MQSRWTAALLTLAASGAVSCTGVISDFLPVESADVDPSNASTVTCAEAPLTPARVRRLTRLELDNSLSDLLGKPVNVAQGFAAEDLVSGFSNHAALQVSPLFADQLDAASQALAAELAAQSAQVAPCPSGKDELQCAQAFIAAFASKAFRRPVTPGETTALLDLFKAGRQDAAYADGISLVVEGVLQSPSFLYRTELGTGASADGRVELTPDEIASALSYFAIAAPPDEALRAAASSGALRTPDEIAAHARRLLTTDPRARPQLRQFVKQWLGLSNLGALQKSTMVFPSFTDALRGAMEAELDAFIDHVLFERDASLQELLAADFTFVDEKLAPHYGLAPPPAGQLARVSLTQLPRRGLLNQAGFLSVFAHVDDSSPVLRGKQVRTRLLCLPMPPPPPDALVTPPAPNPALTTRERVAAHTQSAACAGCHALIDPIGFGLEDFDGIGRHRTTENGKPVDAQGTLSYAATQTPFTGGAQLAAALAEHPAVASCANVQLFRYTYGRVEQKDDACALEKTRVAFEQSGLSVIEQLVAQTRNTSFITRRVTP